MGASLASSDAGGVAGGVADTGDGDDDLMR